MADSDDIDEADRRLFLQAVKGARPLSGGKKRVARRVMAVTASPPPVRRRHSPEPARFVVEQAGAQVTGRAADVSRRDLRALRRSGPRPEATLDLHGFTVAQARLRIPAFIAGARQRGLTVVAIIHGRGLHSGPEGGVLADVTVQVLTGDALAPVVLAFTSAPPALGGGGTLLVRLRRG